MVIQTSLVSALRKTYVSCGYWLFAFSFNYLVLCVYEECTDFSICWRLCDLHVIRILKMRWLFYLDRRCCVKAFQDFIANALLFNGAAFGIHGRGWRYIYRSLSVITICCYLCFYSLTYWSMFVVLGSWFLVCFVNQVDSWKVWNALVSWICIFSLYLV